MNIRKTVTLLEEINSEYGAGVNPPLRRVAIAAVLENPLAGKAVVKGPGAHPFYKWAAAERPLETPHWNFHKYLIGRDGRIAAVFPTETEPADPKVVAAIARETSQAE